MTPFFKKIFLPFFLIACLSCILMPKAHFKLEEATSQQWTAGMAGGGSGTEYTFKVLIQTSGKLSFDSAWINGKGFRIQAVKGNQYNPQSEILKNDTIRLRVSDVIPGKGPNSTPAEPIKNNVKPPVKYKGEALIRYALGNKHHYYTVTHIKKLNPLNMP